MCEDCGCDSGAKTVAVNLQTGKVTALDGERHASGQGHGREHVHADGTRHSHSHSHGTHHVHTHARADGPDRDRAPAHDHDHEHQHTSAPLVDLGIRVLAKNDALAARNRTWLADRGILALNLMSAPGAGKTTLLERTIRDMKTGASLFVLEGDQATANDGERIRAAGAAVVQINTGTGCHLDADMVARGLLELNPSANSVVVVENVGNLVCPALFDLGERRRIVILSTTEGDDKPLKYPHMFRAADLMLVNKIDLLPYVEFDVSRATANALSVNPDISVLGVSARTGEGLDAWYAWLRQEKSAACEAAAV